MIAAITKWLALRTLLPMLALLVVAMPSQGSARPLAAGEQTSLASTVASFAQAMKEATFDRIVATVPPRILEHIAKKNGIEAEQIKLGMIEVMRKAFASVRFESFGMDLAAAATKELPDGEPYVLIPTHMAIAHMSGQRVERKTQTLALMDGGTWYLVRISEAPQVAMLREVYPQFATVELPSE